jgi:hypothetical protein
VHLPNQTANTKRTQMVSSVDFFGLICGLAQSPPTSPAFRLGRTRIRSFRPAWT